MLNFFLHGILAPTPWQLIGIGLLLTHITIASVTIFLHRHQSHHTLELHPLASHLFRFWLWLTTGMLTKEWVAVHRKHHAKCETPEDPHSPVTYGLRTVLRKGAELYVKETEKPETLERYGAGTPADWLERNLYSRYHHLGLGILLALDLALFGVLGLTLWAVQMLWIPLWAAGVINGLGHYSGYRNFETPDASRNIVPLGIFIGGEELHNNHHAYPFSAKLSAKWWEFDIGWLYIRILALCGLARIKTVAPIPVIDRTKNDADRDTVVALVKNRFHVMSLYSRRVMLPVLRYESKGADAEIRRLFKAVRPVMVREFLPPGELVASRVLKNALDNSQMLATAYQFKEQLRTLWANAALSQEMRLEALRDWCKRAEETRIHYLQSFAETLRGYAMLEYAHS